MRMMVMLVLVGGVVGRPQHLPTLEPLPPLPVGIDTSLLQALLQEHPQALGEPRQMARFLAGLTSPALTRAKLAPCTLWSLGTLPLSRHP